MGNHRADRRDTRPVNSGARVRGGGRRRAEKAPRHELTGLSMIPTVAGALALAVAAGGAVTAGAGQAWAHEAAASTTHGLMTPTATELDTLGIDHSLDDRQRAISRDSERDAQRDAADEELKRADESQARQRNAALSSLAKSAERQASKIARNRWVLPTSGYHLTARFGMSGGLWSSNHTGLDFAAPSGTPIVAVADGTITKTGYDGSYGNKTVETLGRHRDLVLPPVRVLRPARRPDPRRPPDRQHRRDRQRDRPPPPPRGPPRWRRPGGSVQRTGSSGAKALRARAASEQWSRGVRNARQGAKRRRRLRILDASASHAER